MGQDQGRSEIGGGGCGMSADASSPPSYANEGDPGYMGYASNNEIIAALQELLEAVPAGARVALVSRSEAEVPDTQNPTAPTHSAAPPRCATLPHECGRATSSAGGWHDA